MSEHVETMEAATEGWLAWCKRRCFDGLVRHIERMRAALSYQAPSRREAALQARIDELMLEHCPGEMTEAQVANWAVHQQAYILTAPEKAAIDRALLRNVRFLDSLDEARPVGAMPWGLFMPMELVPIQFFVDGGTLQGKDPWAHPSGVYLVNQADQCPVTDDMFCLETMTRSELRGYDYGCDQANQALAAVLDGDDDGQGVSHEPWETLRRRVLALKAHALPIDMVMHCPKCGQQHIDRIETAPPSHTDPLGQIVTWPNAPHKSHLCKTNEGGCGHIWRPADVATNGVARVTTKGSADEPVVRPARMVDLNAVAEVSRLRSVIRTVVRETHNASPGIVTLHIIDGERA